MRIAAAVLVVVGSLLTLTIVWAAVGFLMMGFGLICGLVAERRERRHIQRPAQLARAKSSRAAKRRTPAPVVRYGGALPAQLPGRGSSHRAFVRSSPMPDFESSSFVDPDEDAAAPADQVYHVDTAGYDWVEAEHQPFSGEGSTRSPRHHTVVVSPSHLVSNGTAQLSEEAKEKIEEAEQLIKLLNRMSAANTLGS